MTSPRAAWPSRHSPDIDSPRFRRSSTAPSHDQLGGFLSRPQLRFASRLVGAHRAASDDLYDAGSKPHQDANLPSVVIGPGDIQDDAAAPRSQRSTDLMHDEGDAEERCHLAGTKHLGDHAAQERPYPGKPQQAHG